MESGVEFDASRSIPLTISALNRSLENPPPAYLGVFRLFPATGDAYLRDIESDTEWNDLLVSGLSCVLRVGSAKGPIRRRSLEFLRIIVDNADSETATSLCKDLNALLFDRRAPSLGVTDRFIVVSILSVMIRKCQRLEFSSWVLAMMDKKKPENQIDRTYAVAGAAVLTRTCNVATDQVIDKTLSTIDSLHSRYSSTAVYLASCLATSCELSPRSKEELSAICIKAINGAEEVQTIKLWVTVLVRLENFSAVAPSLVSRPSVVVSSGKKKKTKSKMERPPPSSLDPFRTFWKQVPFSSSPSAAFWFGVYYLEQMLSHQEDLDLAVITLLAEELENQRSTLSNLSDIIVTAIKRIELDGMLYRTALNLGSLCAEKDESPAAKAIAMSVLTKIIEELGVDTFSINFLDAKVRAPAVMSLHSSDTNERLSAARLLSGVLSAHRWRKNGFLHHLVDELRSEIFRGPQMNLVSALGRCVALCFALDEIVAEDIPTEAIDGLCECSLACLTNEWRRVGSKAISNLALRRSGWALVGVLGRLHPDKIFSANHLDVLIPLWREDLAYVVEESSAEKKVDVANAISNASLRTASLFALEELLKKAEREDWLVSFAGTILGGEAARMISSASESLFWRTSSMEVLHLLRCIQLGEFNGPSFQTCYQVAFLVVREASYTPRIRSRMIISTVSAMGEMLPLMLWTPRSVFIRSGFGAMKDDLGLYFAPHLAGVTPGELLGEAAEAMGALLSRDMNAAHSFLLSLAEAPSLSPIVDAGLSLSIVRRLDTKDLSRVANAGRVFASVQVLLRRALNALHKVSTSSRKRMVKFESALQSWRAWTAADEIGTDASTTIALAYQALAEKGGDALVSGLVHRAEKIIAEGAIAANAMLARALFGIIGTLFNSLFEEKSIDLGYKIVNLVETGLNSSVGELRFAAAEAINHSSRPIAESAESLLTFLVYSMAQGSTESDPHVYLDMSNGVNLSVEGSPQAVTVAAFGTRAVLSACKENRLVLDESIKSTASEIICEVLQWKSDVAFEARSAGLKSLELLWEAIVEQEAVRDDGSELLALKRFFPSDLPQELALTAIVETILSRTEHDSESRDAAAGALLNLIIGAGSDAVVLLRKDIKSVLFKAMSTGCERAYPCLKAMASDLNPDRISDWISVCEHIFSNSVLDVSRFSDEVNSSEDSDVDEELEGVSFPGHGDSELDSIHSGIVGWRPRCAAIGLLQIIADVSREREECRKQLIPGIGVLYNIAKQSILDTGINTYMTLSGVALAKSLASFVVKSGDLVDKKDTWELIQNLMEILRSKLGTDWSPESNCAVFSVMCSIQQLSIENPDVFQRRKFKRFDPLDLKKHLKILVSEDWSEIVQCRTALSLASSSASLVCSLLLQDQENLTAYWKPRVAHLDDCQEVFLAISADTSAMLCDGAEYLSSEGGSVTKPGAPIALLETEFKANVADLIFASVLLQGRQREIKSVLPNLDPDSGHPFWVNMCSPGVNLVFSNEREDKDVEGLLLSLVGWWLTSCQESEPLSDEKKSKIGLCSKALQKILTEWDEPDWEVGAEALKNLGKLSVSDGMEICWELIESKRLKWLHEECLAICAKVLLVVPANGDQREPLMRRALEVAFRLPDVKKPVHKPDDEQGQATEDYILTPIAAFDVNDMVLELMKKSAEVTVNSRLGSVGLKSLVETMCEIAMERLGEVSQTNLELLITSTCIAADTGFRKGMEAGFACAEPVWNMISNAITTGSVETCDTLLQSKAFNGLLLRVPGRSSRTPKTMSDMLTIIASFVTAGSALFTPAADVLLSAYRQGVEKRIDAGEEDVDAETEERVVPEFFTVFISNLLREYRDGGDEGNKALHILRQISADDIEIFGGDLREDERELISDPTKPSFLT
ncbi:hypothetical protein NDN08_003890 [Rhodosorus marinus]|uniref:HEAT repeat-containing protein 1 n=1 Tax=Rhodosorus marinus TaxID=101924 RepID=A0AAV8UGR8_9RHOD|nr:hypothetical protein NDN08_003890 [Rhodosorus marinus]